MSTATQQTRIDELKARFPSLNPNKQAAKKTTVSRSLANHICSEVLKRDPAAAARWLRRNILSALPLKSAWHKQIRTLANRLETVADPQNGIASLGKKTAIFAPGNSKLSFFAFSSLPGHTCPGAGACLAWCYSFRAWRYAGALCRQLLNAMLLKYRPDIVSEAFRALPHGVIVRLYVDGDFSSVSDVQFWMNELRFRADLKAYGYSKSWAELLDYGRDNKYPNNYVLNLSSGSMHNTPAQREKMAQLLCDDGNTLVRGGSEKNATFTAVPLSKDAKAVLPKGSKAYSHPAYAPAVRAAALRILDQKVFACPGKCDSCRPDGIHACGDRNFRAPIAIGLH